MKNKHGKAETVKGKAEANKIYNKTYDRVYDWHMSSYDPHAGFEFPKPRWRHEEEANKIALEEADKGVRNYYETKNQYLNNI